MREWERTDAAAALQHDSRFPFDLLARRLLANFKVVPLDVSNS